MWIARLALRRPYTVAVMALLMLVLGALSLSRMIVDIFPVIDIPVVIVVRNYPGLSPEDGERRVVLHPADRIPFDPGRGGALLSRNQD
jgi:multidrug efflux pump subunit AcrB